MLLILPLREASITCLSASQFKYESLVSLSRDVDVPGHGQIKDLLAV